MTVEDSKGKSSHLRDKLQVWGDQRVPLRGNGHPLAVGGPLAAVVLQHLTGCLEGAGVEEEGADHQPSPALPGLAVDGRHVVGVLQQPLLHVATEGENQT